MCYFQGHKKEWKPAVLPKKKTNLTSFYKGKEAIEREWQAVRLRGKINSENDSATNVCWNCSKPLAWIRIPWLQKSLLSKTFWWSADFLFFSSSETRALHELVWVVWVMEASQTRLSPVPPPPSHSKSFSGVGRGGLLHKRWSTHYLCNWNLQKRNTLACLSSVSLWNKYPILLLALYFLF